MLTIAILSILVLTAGAALFKKYTSWKICPICAGVSGTWAWMLAARSWGYPVDSSLLAMLLGASVTGIAYRAEKRLAPGQSPLLWKVFFVPAGLVAVFGVVSKDAVLFWGGIGSALLVAITFFGFPRLPKKIKNTPVGVSAEVKFIEKEMEKCC